MKNSIPRFLLTHNHPATSPVDGRRRSFSLVERGIATFAYLMQQTIVQWELSSQSGPLQSLDARIKVLFWACLLVVISLRQTVSSLAGIAGMIALLALIARVNLKSVYSRVLPLAFFFGLLLSAPAMLNIFSPGTVVLPVVTLSAPVSVLTIPFPQQIGFTSEGITICLKLTLRVFASLSLSFLMLSVTPFSEIVRALKLFRVPDSLLLILTLTWKYIYLFAEMVRDMYRAKKTRLVLGIGAADFRVWSAGRMATVFRKTQMRADDIYRAMLCRGFSGEIRIVGGRSLRRSDAFGACLLTAFVLAALVV